MRLFLGRNGPKHRKWGLTFRMSNGITWIECSDSIEFKLRNILSTYCIYMIFQTAAPASRGLCSRRPLIAQIALTWRPVVPSRTRYCFNVASCPGIRSAVQVMKHHRQAPYFIFSLLACIYDGVSIVFNPDLVINGCRPVEEFNQIRL
jgi:hypothetical protein